MKSQTRIKRDTARNQRAAILYSYRERIFNLYLSTWTTPGLLDEQREFMLRRFYEDGVIAAFSYVNINRGFNGGISPNALKAVYEDTALMGLAPYAFQNLNSLNFPTSVTLINTRGAPYIPSRVMTVNKDVVLGWAQHSRAPLQTIVFEFLDRIVDVEMVIKMNLYAQKMPLAIVVTQDSKETGDSLALDLDNDQPRVFISAKTLDSVRGVSSGVPFTIDKLYAYKQKLENELYTFLGIDNIGGSEKKERMIVDEANANNLLIDHYATSIKQNLDEFAVRVKKVLGFSFSFKNITGPVKPDADTKEKEETENADKN